MKIIPHPKISSVYVLRNKNFFSIHWLYIQGYCEYQIFLEYFLVVKKEPTPEMKEGNKTHKDSYLEFEKEAVPTTFKEMLKESKTQTIISQEFPIRSLKYGIYGRIDKVILTPKEFIIVDKKRTSHVYESNINQIFGYCLAFEEKIQQLDNS